MSACLEKVIFRSRVIVLFTYILRANSLNDILSMALDQTPNIQRVLVMGHPLGRVAQVLIKADDSRTSKAGSVFACSLSMKSRSPNEVWMV